MKKMLVLAWAVLVPASAVVAQETAPTPNKETIVRRPGAPASPAEPEVAVPPAPTLDRSPRQVTIPGPGGSRNRDSAGAGALKGILARDVRSGQARVLLAAGERTVRPGDLIGTDRIQSIEPGRLLLGRPVPGGEALVVVTFDEGGRGRVRILYENDPKPVVAPALR